MILFQHEQPLNHIVTVTVKKAIADHFFRLSQPSTKRLSNTNVEDNAMHVYSFYSTIFGNQFISLCLLNSFQLFTFISLFTIPRSDISSYFYKVMY